ncbi:hypothetical protein Nepgr_028215 [Nepenthes gracilis]|uniref:PLAC8 family protein n=1 Tax=Nepenthes gracilis TaxID=150966 RepID=A0AAD3TD89_NEPGR|nr:hypothetical protein Nepgr_028215 [Nepenthes gracilis]
MQVLRNCALSMSQAIHIEEIWTRSIRPTIQQDKTLSIDDHHHEPTIVEEEEPPATYTELQRNQLNSASSQLAEEQRHGIITTSAPPPSRIQRFKKWLRNPLSKIVVLYVVIILLLSVISVLISGGGLNGILPEKQKRDVWKDAVNQIINALVTLTCIYQHPWRFRHLVLLCRWKPTGIRLLREAYCRNGASKPHERAHMAVLITLIHLNYFAQYAICVCAWKQKRNEAITKPLLFSILVAVTSGLSALLYSICSPLGRAYDSAEEEPEAMVRRRKVTFSLRKRSGSGAVETRPEWIGGVFDVTEDAAEVCLSFLCTSCVFGWNLERVGFGGMYCQTVTFLLFCLAPLLVLNLAAINIDDHAVTLLFFVISVLLSWLGLLYGGVWRIRVRDRFNLPSYSFCFGRPDAVDCLLWLCCCCCCSLSQEVRTFDFYDAVVREGSLSRNGVFGNGHPPCSSMLCELDACRSSVDLSLGGHSRGGSGAVDGVVGATDGHMRPPISPRIQREI